MMIFYSDKICGDTLVKYIKNLHKFKRIRYSHNGVIFRPLV